MASEPLGARAAQGDDAPAGFRALVERALDACMAAPAEAVAAAEQALALLPADADAALRAEGLRAHGLALVYGDAPAQAIGVLQAALAAVPPDRLRLRTQVERALSIACHRLAVLDDALAWGVRAAESARAAGDEALLADALLSAGVARSNAGDVEGGLDFFQEALRIHEAAGRTRTCASVLNNIGINCKNLGRHAEAVGHLRRAEVLLLADGSDAGALAMARTNLAEPLWRLGRLDEAQALLEQALQALDGRVYAGFECHARHLLGQVLRARGERDAAQAELERALHTAAAQGRLDIQARIHLALCELHRDAGRFEDALRQHEAFHAADRRRIDDEAARRLQALQVQADLARARHEAEVYRLRHGELAQAHAELEALNQALLAADRDKSDLLRRLEAQSRTDALTGLANRRHLDERLDAELTRARRLGHPLALAMVDLDNFKQVNDRLGHAVGDEVLRRTARVLAASCRDIDLVARYGGEEFCLVFVEAGRAHAQRACEAARVAVASQPWREVHPDLVVTLSIGVAGADESDEAAVLLAAADRRLYDAKRHGKNRVVAGEAA